MKSLFVVAMLMLSAPAMAGVEGNPDGRPSVTFTMGYASGNDWQTASAYGQSVDSPKFGFHSYGPSLDFRIPSSRSVTILFGVSADKYKGDGGTATSGSLTAQIDNKFSRFSGHAGVRFYFGK